jgi:hypothetical protein
MKLLDIEMSEPKKGLISPSEEDIIIYKRINESAFNAI